MTVSRNHRRQSSTEDCPLAYESIAASRCGTGSPVEEEAVQMAGAYESILIHLERPVRRALSSSLSHLSERRLQLVEQRLSVARVQECHLRDSQCDALTHRQLQTSCTDGKLLLSDSLRDCSSSAPTSVRTPLRTFFVRKRDRPSPSCGASAECVSTGDDSDGAGSAGCR